MKALIPIVFFLVASGNIQAQQQWDPKAMAEREKMKIYEILTDISEDQKLVVDQIYESYATKLEALFTQEESDREKRRASFMAIRDEKQQLLKEVLTKEQFEIVTEELSKNRRPQ